MRAEAHLVIVHREVDDAAAELKEPLAWLAVALVLLHGIGHGLLGQAVLQLEGGDGQAVDEEAQVEGQGVPIAAVAQLPGDAETVMRVTLGGDRIAGRRRAVEQVELVRPVLDAVAQHVDHAALRNLPLQPRQELAPRRAVLGQVQRGGRLGLGDLQEDGELHQVDAVLAVVVVPITQQPARAAVERGRCTDRARRGPARGRPHRLAGHGGDDQAFEAFFAGVGRAHVRLRWNARHAASDASKRRYLVWKSSNQWRCTSVPNAGFHDSAMTSSGHSSSVRSPDGSSRCR